MTDKRMQDVTPQLTKGAQRIESYGPAGFRIAGITYAGSVLVRVEATENWSVTSAADITLESLAPLIAATPEVLIIGTGPRHEMIPPALRMALKQKGIASDSMDTGAAVRTFDILLAEGRKVAAALLLP